MRCFNPFPGGYSAVAPPDPIPNSEVKRSCAEGSVALPMQESVTARGFILKTLTVYGEGFFLGGTASRCDVLHEGF